MSSKKKSHIPRKSNASSFLPKAPNKEGRVSRLLSRGRSKKKKAASAAATGGVSVSSASSRISTSSFNMSSVTGGYNSSVSSAVAEMALAASDETDGDVTENIQDAILNGSVVKNVGIKTATINNTSINDTSSLALPSTELRSETSFAATMGSLSRSLSNVDLLPESQDSFRSMNSDLDIAAGTTISKLTAESLLSPQHASSISFDAEASTTYLTSFAGSNNSNDNTNKNKNTLDSHLSKELDQDSLPPHARNLMSSPKSRVSKSSRTISDNSKNSSKSKKSSIYSDDEDDFLFNTTSSNSSEIIEKEAENILPASSSIKTNSTDAMDRVSRQSSKVSSRSPATMEKGAAASIVAAHARRYRLKAAAQALESDEDDEHDCKNNNNAGSSKISSASGLPPTPPVPKSTTPEIAQQRVSRIKELRQRKRDEEEAWDRHASKSPPRNRGMGGISNGNSSDRKGGRQPAEPLCNRMRSNSHDSDSVTEIRRMSDILNEEQGKVEQRLETHQSLGTKMKKKNKGYRQDNEKEVSNYNTNHGDGGRQTTNNSLHHYGGGSNYKQISGALLSSQNNNDSNKGVLQLQRLSSNISELTNENHETSNVVVSPLTRENLKTLGEAADNTSNNGADTQPPEGSHPTPIFTTVTNDPQIPNLHRSLHTSDWRTFHNNLRELRLHPTWIMPALTHVEPSDKTNSTVLHTGVWKAPPRLSLMLIALLPVSKEFAGLLLCRDFDGNTPLHLCAANVSRSSTIAYDGKGGQTNDRDDIDRVEALKQLVKKSPRALNLQNAEGDTPLHLVVSSSRSSPAATLNLLTASIAIDAEFIINYRDITGATALHSAIGNRAPFSVVSLLLNSASLNNSPNQHSSSIDKELSSLSLATSVDVGGYTPLHYLAVTVGREGCIGDNESKIVELLIQTCPQAVSLQSDDNGDTPLHLLVSNGNTTASEKSIDKTKMIDIKRDLDAGTRKVLTCLLKCTSQQQPQQQHDESMDESYNDDDYHSSPLLATNKEKLNPLHCCAIFDIPPAISAHLMSHPTSSRASIATNTFGATPLHLAAAQPSVSTALSTIQTIGTPQAASMQDRLRRTPLHVAAQNVHATPELIDILAQLYPMAASMKTQRGHLPLHLAAQSQAKEPVIKALIQAYPNATEARNKSSNTPLHDAAKYRASLGTVKALLETYPDAIFIQNQYGNLPLHCATAYQASNEVIQLLLRAWPDGASMQNRNQDAPLHYAAAYASSVESIKSLIEAAPAAVLLLNSSGQSPIDRARANMSNHTSLSSTDTIMNGGANAGASEDNGVGGIANDIVEFLERKSDEWTANAAKDGWGAF